jgi:hypothetical protein
MRLHFGHLMPTGSFRLVLRFFSFISDGFCLMLPHQQLWAGVRFNSYVGSPKY